PHAAQGKLEIIFLPHPRLGPFNGDASVAGEGLHPVLVDAGALRQNLLADRWYSHYLAKEIDHLLGPRQPRQIAMDDKAVKTVIHKQQQVSQKACEQLHRSPPCLVWTTRSSENRPMESKFQISLASLSNNIRLTHGVRAYILQAR